MAGNRWNHNIHYHRVVLDAVPDGGGRALDVGCGEGMLSRDLAAVLPEVVGLDLHGPSLDLARQHLLPGLSYVQGDVLDPELDLGSFDLVASIAALHHMDTATALRRMADLLCPGGTLVVIGLARSQFPKDLPRELAAAIGTRLHKLTKTYWEHSAPIVWPPPDTFGELRRIAERTLPGVRYRRHLLWRYSLVWTRP